VTIGSSNERDLRILSFLKDFCAITGELITLFGALAVSLIFGELLLKYEVFVFVTLELDFLKTYELHRVDSAGPNVPVVTLLNSILFLALAF
jgi:hypothetical protein